MDAVEVDICLRWTVRWIEREVCYHMGNYIRYEDRPKEIERLIKEGYMPEGYHRIRRLLGEE